MRFKSDSKDKGKSLSPLEARQRALAEQQAKLNQEIQKREKLLSEAPKLAEQAARQRREELLQRKSRSEARFGSPVALRDPRYAFEANTHTARPEPRLRKDRNQGMVTFFVLCLVLAAVVFWFYTKVIQGG